MPITVNRYMCPHCRTVYKTFEQAMQCEMAPIPLNPFPEGTTMTFENEESMFGSRYSYSSSSGVVLFAMLDYNEKNKSHQWVWIVKPSDRFGTECAVVFGEDDFGTRLFSPAEFKYRSGYAEALKLERSNLY